MLARVDKSLAILSWIAAAVLAVMLIAGPTVVAHDSNKATKAAAGASPYAATTPSTAPDGKALFKSNCGSCHTLSAAGTTGAVGPNLEGKSTAEVEAAMKAGPGAMPSFTNSLSPAEIKAVAKFVSSS